jgi:hypothetical protein
VGADAGEDLGLRVRIREVSIRADFICCHLEAQLVADASPPVMLCPPPSLLLVCLAASGTSPSSSAHLRHSQLPSPSRHKLGMPPRPTSAALTSLPPP